MSKTDQGRTVYVGNIDQRVTIEQLYELFVQLSPVTHISYPRDKLTQEYLGYAFVEFASERDLEYVLRLLREMDSGANNNNNSNNDVNNNSNRHGGDGDTGSRGKDDAGGIKLYGKPLRIRVRSNVSSGGTGDEVSKDNGIELPVAKLFVKNLSPEITLATLNKVFGKIGPLVTSATSFVRTGKSRRNDITEGKRRKIATGCATICYKYYRDADKGIAALNGEMLANQRITVEYALKGNGSRGRYGSSSDRYLNEQAEKNGLL